MKLLPEEKETILLFDETGNPADLWTCSPRVAQRLIKAGLKPAQEPKEEGYGWRFYLDKQDIRVKVGSRSCYVGGRKQAKAS